MNKKEKYPDEYKLTSSLMPKIAFLLVLGSLIGIWFVFNWQEDWLFLCVFSIVCVCYLFYILQNIEYAIFNHTGVLIVLENRWGKKRRKQEFYINWKDVKYIKFKTPLSKNSSLAIDIESRIFGRSYHNQTSLPYGKFASLAKYYSGREDITNTKSRLKWKHKPFEKDW